MRFGRGILLCHRGSVMFAVFRGKGKTAGQRKGPSEHIDPFFVHHSGVSSVAVQNQFSQETAALFILDIIVFHLWQHTTGSLRVYHQVKIEKNVAKLEEMLIWLNKAFPKLQSPSRRLHQLRLHPLPREQTLYLNNTAQAVSRSGFRAYLQGRGLLKLKSYFDSVKARQSTQTGSDSASQNTQILRPHNPRPNFYLFSSDINHTKDPLSLQILHTTDTNT